MPAEKHIKAVEDLFAEREELLKTVYTEFLYPTDNVNNEDVFYKCFEYREFLTGKTDSPNLESNEYFINIDDLNSEDKDLLREFLGYGTNSIKNLDGLTETEFRKWERVLRTNIKALTTTADSVIVKSVNAENIFKTNFSFAILNERTEDLGKKIEYLYLEIRDLYIKLQKEREFSFLSFFRDLVIIGISAGIGKLVSGALVAAAERVILKPEIAARLSSLTQGVNYNKITGITPIVPNQMFQIARQVGPEYYKLTSFGTNAKTFIEEAIKDDVKGAIRELDRRIRQSGGGTLAKPRDNSLWYQIINTFSKLTNHDRIIEIAKSEILGDNNFTIQPFEPTGGYTPEHGKSYLMYLTNFLLRSKIYLIYATAKNKSELYGIPEMETEAIADTKKICHILSYSKGIYHMTYAYDSPFNEEAFNKLVSGVIYRTYRLQFQPTRGNANWKYIKFIFIPDKNELGPSGDKTCLTNISETRIEEIENFASKIDFKGFGFAAGKTNFSTPFYTLRMSADGPGGFYPRDNDTIFIETLVFDQKPKAPFGVNERFYDIEPGFTGTVLDYYQQRITKGQKELITLVNFAVQKYVPLIESVLSSVSKIS